MTKPLYIITGKNRMTGQRDQLSRPMDEYEAVARLDRELANRRLHKHPAYTHLQIERLEAIQQTINFEQ